jgi:hypothetical protein
MATIYTVIPYFDTSDDVFTNDVNSFYKLEDAQVYGYSLGMRFEIVSNQLN